MDIAVYLISILMWILCPAVIGLILLQGAAGDISSAFGGGGQLDASLGVGAHRKMAQVTGVLAVLFFVMVLIMAYPHRNSFQNLPKNAAPAPTPATIPQPVSVELVKPEAAKPVAPEGAKPEAAQPAPEAKPEAAQPAPEAKPEVPVMTTPTLVPNTTPTVVPADPADPADPAKP